MTPLHDMHCHLGFMQNGEDVAADAQIAGTLLFTNTVTPDEWEESRERFCGFNNVAIGFGMHPWWVAGDVSENVTAELSRSDKSEAEAQRNRVVSFLEENNPALIGEVGLDFGRNHIDTHCEQLAMFNAISSWAAKQNGKLLSIHAVKASKEALDILEQTRAVESCICVFHWFSGPSDLLKRAIEVGCYFSCNPRMLATGKGREYVKAIPKSRLLLETDAPPQQGMPFSYAEQKAELECAAACIAAIKGEDALETIARTSESILLETR